MAFDATSVPRAATRLRNLLGTGPLAGIYRRAGRLVHVPYISDAGRYVPLDTLTHADKISGAAVIPVTWQYLQGLATEVLTPTRRTKHGEQPTVMPQFAAQSAVELQLYAQHVKPLNGVTHTPIAKPGNGTLITDAGHDEATGWLHMPVVDVPPVSWPQVQQERDYARHVILDLLSTFPFETPDHQANYIGMMMTPLLRLIAPPPYKLGVIMARSPGAGKSLLEKGLRILHEGVMHAEMPTDDDELEKIILSDLRYSTAPVITFDNLTGRLKSPKLAALLTSNTYTGRLLGSSNVTTVQNDRLWVATGNNVQIDGDMARRVTWVMIDPGVPNPERRVFQRDFIAEITEQRGEILWALLALISDWQQAGSVPGDAPSDAFRAWTSTIRGILQHAEIPGVFDNEATRHSSGVTDDDELGIFLKSVWQQRHSDPWTVKSIMTPESPSNDGPIIDNLPTYLHESYLKAKDGPKATTRALGRYLSRNEGRWSSGLTVRGAGVSRGLNRWRVEVAPGYEPEEYVAPNTIVVEEPDWSADELPL